MLKSAIAGTRLAVSSSARRLSTRMAAKQVKVTVFSDLACPWCYVGQRRLDAALEAMPDVQADKEWHAFLLDWNAQQGGQPIEDALRAKFGPQAPALLSRVVNAGRQDGVPFADWKWRANTVGGHVLVALARRHGKSHAANQLLFQKTYEQGLNISDPQVLLEAGRALGLPEQELQAALGDGEMDGELLKEVQQDDRQAKSELQISGVPFFLISAGGGPIVVLSGAQPAEKFQEAVRRALKEADSISGGGAQACSASDGCC